MFKFIYYGQQAFESKDFDAFCVQVYSYYRSEFYNDDRDANIQWWQSHDCVGFSTDKSLHLYALVAHGSKIADCLNTYEHYNSDQWRRGSVKGIRKWRGGGGYMRRIATKAESSQNMMVCAEYGMTLVRGARRKLPNSWDDFVRQDARVKCWKSQHKGMKSWDRETKRKSGQQATNNKQP